MIAKPARKVEISHLIADRLWIVVDLGEGEIADRGQGELDQKAADTRFDGRENLRRNGGQKTFAQRGDGEHEHCERHYRAGRQQGLPGYASARRELSQEQVQSHAASQRGRGLESKSCHRGRGKSYGAGS